MKNRLVVDLGKTIAVLVLIIILLMPIIAGKMDFGWERTISHLESEEIPVLLRYESAGEVFGITVNGLGKVDILVPKTSQMSQPR